MPSRRKTAPAAPSVDEQERQLLAQLEAIRAKKALQAAADNPSPAAGAAPIAVAPGDVAPSAGALGAAAAGAAAPGPASRRAPRKAATSAEPRTRIDTGGGSAVQGSVTLSSGHFIGRDFIQIVDRLIVASDDAEHAKLALADYLAGLVEELAMIPLADIEGRSDNGQRQPLTLADVYAPLDVAFTLPEKQTLAQALAASRRPDRAGRGTGNLGEAPEDGQEARRATALEALACSPALTLLGAAGSGKSTFGAHVLLGLAQAWQGRGDAAELIGPVWTGGPLLPLRVVLRRFAERHATGTEPLQASHLWDHIASELHRSGWGRQDRALDAIQLLVRKHGALVVFDGLDECGPRERQQRVHAAVSAFMHAAGPRSRFLLTARPSAFPDGADPPKGIFELAELSQLQIEAFIERWYTALVVRGWQTAEGCAPRRNALLAEVPKPYLLPLARNPLLLTLVAAVSNRAKLPDGRLEVYDETVKLLLERWKRDQGEDRSLLGSLEALGLGTRNLRTELERLAFEAHEASVGKEGLAEIGEDHLVRAFARRLRGDKNKATEVVEFFERRTGLLIGQGRRGDREDGERRFAFPHRSFQEYLAACHLNDHQDFSRRCKELADQDCEKGTAHWRLVLQMAAGLARAQRGAFAAEGLIGSRNHAQACSGRHTPTAADWQRALLAGEMLAEIGPAALEAETPSQRALNDVRSWLLAGLPMPPSRGGAKAPVRAAMGDVLSRLGDPRFDPQRLHLPADDDLGFVLIPADPDFCIGTRRADRKRVEAALGGGAWGIEAELNDEPTPTPAFWMARYPVTVAQFGAYLEATGREAADRRALQDADSRPVRYVDWYEARGYSQWLHQQLLTCPALSGSAPARLLQQGWRAALPSELEWERAARGGAVGQVFPWGDEPDGERANVHESRIQDSCAVACFEPNGFGLHDMIGNVWEWTRSLWGSGVGKAEFGYPYRADDTKREDERAPDKVLRLVRGGAWYCDPGSARCAFRGRRHPRSRNLDLGFRVVLSAAPVFPGTAGADTSGL